MGVVAMEVAVMGAVTEVGIRAELLRAIQAGILKAAVADIHKAAVEGTRKAQLKATPQHQHLLPCTSTLS